MPFFKKYEEISDERRDEMISFIISKVEKYGVFVPALFLLETGQPLSFVFSQLAYGGAPFTEVLVADGQTRVEDYAQIFEDRKNLNILIERMQERAAEVQIEEEKEKIRIKRMKAKMKADSESSGETSKKKKGFKFPWSK